MAEYKYTIEVTLRSEVPKSNSLNVPAQGNPNALFNVAQLMPIISEVMKNVKVENKEVEKK